jgi:hypothetical protein
MLKGRCDDHSLERNPFLHAVHFDTNLLNTGHTLHPGGSLCLPGRWSELICLWTH